MRSEKKTTNPKPKPSAHTLQSWTASWATGVGNAALPLKSKGITSAQHLGKDAQPLEGSSAS